MGIDEGTATNVMVGIGETYLPSFVLALTGSQLACGLMSTLSLVIGAIRHPGGLRHGVVRVPASRVVCEVQCVVPMPHYLRVPLPLSSSPRSAW